MAASQPNAPTPRMGAFDRSVDKVDLSAAIARRLAGLRRTPVVGHIPAALRKRRRATASPWPTGKQLRLRRTHVDRSREGPLRSRSRRRLPPQRRTLFRPRKYGGPQRHAGHHITLNPAFRLHMARLRLARRCERGSSASARPAPSCVWHPMCRSTRIGAARSVLRQLLRRPELQHCATHARRMVVRSAVCRRAAGLYAVDACRSALPAASSHRRRLCRLCLDTHHVARPAVVVVPVLGGSMPQVNLLSAFNLRGWYAGLRFLRG